MRIHQKLECISLSRFNEQHINIICLCTGLYVDLFLSLSLDFIDFHKSVPKSVYVITCSTNYMYVYTYTLYEELGVFLLFLFVEESNYSLRESLSSLLVVIIV